MALQETMIGPNQKFRIPHYHMFHTPGTFSGRYHGGVAILVHENLPIHPEIKLDTPLQAIAIRVNIGIRITICSIYNSRAHPLDKRLLARLLEQLPQPVLMVGDFNAYHPLWGSPTADVRGGIVESFIAESGLNILNDGSPTRVGGTSETHLDLSFISPAHHHNFSWSVLESPFDSDHHPIEISRHIPLNSPTTPRFNINRAHWPSFQNSSAWNNLPADMEEEDLEDLMSCLYARFEKACADSMPLSQTSKFFPKPWWSAALMVSRNRREAFYKRYRRNKSPYNLTQWKKARAEHRLASNKHKKESWENYIKTITVNTSIAEVWEKIKSIKGREARRIYVLKEGDTLFETDIEIANKLAKTLHEISSTTNYHPDFQIIKHNIELTNLGENTENNYIHNQNFSMSELNNAINSLKSNKAPGPDTIHNKMITHLPEQTKNYLLMFFNKIWDIGKLPKAWKESTIIPIPKPKKDTSDPRNYRPIALTSVLSKVMEKMVNNRLLNYLESRYIFDKHQCGGRRQRSTLDHLVRLETLVRNSFANGKHTLAVSFDMQKAYDMTWKKGIIKDLHECGVGGKMLAFIRDFLQHRTFKVRVNNVLSESFVQENGIPQGSVLSPTLFILKINKIMSTVPNLDKINYFLYMDDLLITTSHADLQAAGEDLQLAINNLHQWAFSNGFTFAPSKTTAIHFTNKTGLHNTPDLYLNQSRITYEDSMKFLGLTFDSKLTFRKHVTILKARCSKAMNVIKTISSHVWGADQESILRVYRALIRSRLDYGAVVYCSASATTLGMLEPVANEAMRLASGAFRSTTVPTLQNICHEPSLSIRFKKLRINYYLKIRYLINNPAFYSVTNTDSELLFQNKNLTLTFALRVKNDRNELQIPRLPVKASTKQSTFSDRPRWAIKAPHVDFSLGVNPKDLTPAEVYRDEFNKLKSTKYREHKFIYTDGSKTERGVGCAAVYNEVNIDFSLPVLSSIFTAELRAVILALKIITDQNIDNAVICSDSKSVLLTLCNDKFDNPMTAQLKLEIDALLLEGKNIVLCWVPGHSNIPGNELADQKAKLASQKTPQYLPLPYTDYHQYVNDKLQKLWDEDWKSSNSKMVAIKDHARKWVTQENFSRKDEVVFNRLRAGHTFLTHSYLMEGIPTPPVCPYCNITVATVRHILIVCGSLSATRARYLGNSVTIQEVLGKNIQLNVYQFIRRIRLYDKV